MLNKTKFEQLLIAHWTEFLNAREILDFVAGQAQSSLKVNGPINKVTLTRFELDGNGFILWFEFETSQKVHATLEARLTCEGEIKPVRVELA